MEGNDALAADQILDAGLLDPAVGFVALDLEFRHRLGVPCSPIHQNESAPKTATAVSAAALVV